MSHSIDELFANTFRKKNTSIFLFCHAFFWVLISIITFFTLSLWYGSYDWGHHMNILAQSAMGLMLSVPLQTLFKKIWHKSNRYRLVTGFFLIVVCSLFWTLGRMYIYQALTGEGDIWWNFGGWYFSGIFIFLFWTGVFHATVYYMLLQEEHRVLAEVEARRIKAQSEAKEAQLKMLRYQLNPHFLSNTLNAINSLIDSGETNLSQLMVVNLSKFLRYSLDSDPNGKVTLTSEIDALNLYLDIEKVRFGNRLQVQYHIDPLAENGLMPSLLLQPIIENSMKHVISKHEEGGKIIVTAAVMDNELHLNVSDLGFGYVKPEAKSNKPKHRSVGLKNVQDRINNLYPDNCEFSMFNQEDGSVSTQIIIPFDTETLSNEKVA